jgi:endonuclease/exonuclease/phosphatase family metal-dependent hydrolase
MEISISYGKIKNIMNKQNKRSIRILSFNIRHAWGLDRRTKLSRIASEIREADPDIVALQEVDRYHLRSGFRDQYRILAESLDMQGCFAPSLNWGLTQYGNAILTRLPLLSSTVRYLPGTQERRSALTARISLGGAALSVITTHLGLLDSERTRQMSHLSESLREAGEPAVLLGDFNMNPDNKLLQPLKPDWRKIPLDRKTSTVKGGGEIDHIYIRIPGASARAWTQSTIASDHSLLLGEISWNV